MDLLLLLLYSQVFVLVYLTVLFFVLFMLYHKRVYYQPRELSDDELPTLSVVIPVYNEGESIRDNLSAIVNCDYPKDKLEVLVVDDASTDNSYAIAKEYERYLFIHVLCHEKNMGAAIAKNTGVKAAKGQLIATLDSDSVVDADTFRRLASYFAYEPDTMAVTATIRIRDPKTVVEKVQALEYDTILFFRRLMSLVDSIYVTPGGLSMFRREVFEKVGLFDPRSLTEDLEIAIRMQRLGYKIKAALDAPVYTRAQPTWGKLIKQRVRWVRGGFWTRLRKHIDLFDVTLGDFFIFGMLLDLMFMIPSSILILTLIYKLVSTPNYMWVDRLGIPSFLFSLFADPLMATSLALLVISFLWAIYAVNRVREGIEDKLLGLENLPELAVFIFVYGYIWPYVWVESLFKEVIGYERRWETR